MNDCGTLGVKTISCKLGWTIVLCLLSGGKSSSRLLGPGPQWAVESKDYFIKRKMYLIIRGRYMLAGLDVFHEHVSVLNLSTINLNRWQDCLSGRQSHHDS